VRAIPERSRALRRPDATGVKATTPTPGKLVASRPLKIVQIDHMEVDVVVVHEEKQTAPAGASLAYPVQDHADAEILFGSSAWR
jgi:hypothetical protein